MNASVLAIKDIFIEFNVDQHHQDLFDKYIQYLPEKTNFSDDEWNIINWSTKKGNSFTITANFGKFNNQILKNLVKCYVLEKRLKRNITPKACTLTINSLVFLDKQISFKDFKNLSNSDFIKTEQLLKEVSNNTAYRYASVIESFGKWLNMVLNLKISYKNQMKSTYLHGRNATDEQREDKIISTPILIELLTHLNNDSLNSKDRFFLSALSLLIPTGFRVNELMTLPKNCLLKEKKGFGICYYPSKKPKLGVRHLPESIHKTVLESYEYLYEETQKGRNIAQKLSESDSFNWRAVLKDEEAFYYFLKKFCHDWTKNEEHYMFNKKGAWFEKEKRYVDVFKMIDESGSILKLSKETGYSRHLLTYLKKAQLAAQMNELPPTQKNPSKNKERTSWDTDSRVISISQFEKSIGIVLKTQIRESAKKIISQAQKYQLKGEIYPKVIYNEKIESAFNYNEFPVIKDKKGNVVLEVKNALFVTEKYKFSESRATKEDNYSLLTTKDFIRWLSGEARSFGTKNIEDSVFSRLNIIDPKTDEIAKFTSHDIRHWLNTFYAEGGLDEESIALYFNRDKRQNATYDQTTSKTRLNNLRKAVKEGKAMGNGPKNYELISEHSKEDAKAYLNSYTLMVNLMPHGTCSLNWNVEPCPHYNSCFNCENKNGETGVCDNFIIDKDNKKHIEGVKSVIKDTKMVLNIMPEESPQYIHVKNIYDNAKDILNDKESENE